MIDTTGHAGAGTDQPSPTIITGGHHAEMRAFLLECYGTDQDPRLAAPLHTVTTKDRFGLLTVHGEARAIVGISLFMLSPRELNNAQGFSVRPPRCARVEIPAAHHEPRR